MKEAFSFSLSNIGLVLFIYQATKFIFEIPIGIVADKYSKKLSVIIGTILQMLSLIMLLLNFKSLVFISFFIKGLGDTFISGSFEAIFVNSIDEDKLIRLNSLERIFFYFGIGISSILGGFVIGLLDYNIIVILDIVVLIVVFIIAIMIKETKVKEQDKVFKTAINTIFEQKFLICFLLIDLVTAISFINIEDFYSTFLSNLGVNIKIIGIIIAIQFFISSILGYFIHSYFKNMNKLKVYMIFSILKVIFAILMYLGTNIFFIPIFYILSTICFSLFAPIKYEIFQSCISSNIRSTVLSIKSLRISLGGIISYFIVFLLGKYLSISNISLILLIITFISYIIINSILYKDIKKFYKNK